MKSELKIFIQNFARYKLAEHLKIDPSLVQFISYFNPLAGYDLEYIKRKYSIKFSNPILAFGKRDMKIWDFDVRENYWEKGHNKKVAKTVSKCDFYLLIGMVDNVPHSIFLIPAQDTPNSHVRISLDGFSKYQQYEI